MKRIIYLLLLLPSLAWGSDLGQDYARMNPYILGSSVPAAACDPASNEIGNRSNAGSNQTVSAAAIFIERYKPDCSGELYQAAVYHDYAVSEKCKVCIFESSGTVPTTSDNLIACSDAATSDAIGWITAVTFPAGHNVDKDTYYWLGIWGGTGGFDTERGSSAGLYYATGQGTYPDSPPSKLTATYNAGSLSPLGVYITIH